MKDKKKLSSCIRTKSRELGFSFCGIAKVEALEDHSTKLDSWLAAGYNADMDWMGNNREKRLDPGILVDGAKSIIIVALNYYQEAGRNEYSPDFSLYAMGKDYHKVLKDKLYLLKEAIEKESGKVSGRIFVDSAPVLERAWAERAGLGWIGKNSMLITRTQGSYLFLGELICDLELEYDIERVRDYCGSCNKCIEACPTRAILEDRTIDSANCLSYLTIEKRGEFEPGTGSLHNKVFGCDICQDVCPWNRTALPHSEPAFEPPTGMLEMSQEEWLELNEDRYNSLFHKSPLSRAGYKKLKQTLSHL